MFVMPTFVAVVPMRKMFFRVRWIGSPQFERRNPQEDRRNEKCDDAVSYRRHPNRSIRIEFQFKSWVRMSAVGRTVIIRNASMCRALTALG